MTHCCLRKEPIRRFAVISVALISYLAIGLSASAQSYMLRYANTTSGAITFSGNTLGLNTAAASGSVGAFITTNMNATAGGGYPNGTTLNWSNNSSSAVLRLPTNSTVLYAELIWAGTCETVSNAAANSGSNVLSYVTNTAVNFVLPNGTTNNVGHDPATFSIVTNFNGAAQQALFYVCSANVTTLVQASGAGTYTVGGVPAEIFPGDTSDDCAGWTLAVAYQNNSLPQRNLSIFVGNYWINAASAADSPPVGVSGFCSPPTGAVNGYLFVSSMEGDPQTSGDQMEFGTTTNSFSVLSGPNNPANNFFCSQINYCQPDNLFGTAITNGYLDTSGSFGLNNASPGSAVAYARQGWDITCVNVSAGLTNGVTSAFAKFITSGDGYSANALALQIDVGSPVLTTTQSVDKASTFVGDTLTYTVVVTNSGTADAMNLIFTDPLPFGTSFIANSFTTNGVTVAGANPVNGVPIPTIKQNAAFTITYQVLVNQIPPSARFITAASINFQYSGACANSPVINGTLVNANVQTLVPLLNVNKVSSLTNVIPGAAMTYTINIPNVGTTNTTGSTLIDPLPAGVTYVTNTTTLNGISVPDLGGTNMPYSVPTLINGPGRPVGVIDVGDTAVVVFQVMIATNPPLRINNTATIYANGIAPTTAQNASANISPVYCDLAAGIIGSPNPVSAGAPISYTVSITNNGPNSLNDITNFIMLSLPLPSSILSPVFTPSLGTYNPLTGVWSGVMLASNDVITLTISGQLSPTAPGTNVMASVTVTPPPGIIDTVTNNNSATASNAIVQVADLTVTISDGVTNVYQGDALTYTITAINLGPSTLTSITLSNSFSTLLTNLTLLPAQGSFNPATGVWNGLNLAAGDSVTFTVLANVRTNVTGGLTNTVVATVPAGVTDPVLTNNNASDVNYVLVMPDLAVSKAGPASVYAGTNFSYSITVTNFTLGIASNVVVSDVLPTNVAFVNASGNGTNNSGTVSWNLGAFAADAGSNLTLTVTAPFTGNFTNVASVSASTPDANTNNDISAPVGTTVTPLADLAVGKTAPASVIATSNFTYTISVTNFGPSPAGSVIVTDTLLASVTFVSATGGGVKTGGGVSWTLGSLISGQVSNVTLTVKAPASGSVTNTASISSTALDTNLVNNTSAPVITLTVPLAQSADLAVTKSGPANVLAGTNFNYTITVTNLGPGSASNTVVSDVLPASLVFVSASGGGTTNAGVVTWNLGTITNHAATNLTVTVSATAGGTLTNLASLSASTADPDLTNNVSPPVMTSVTPVADVGIGKAAAATVLATSDLTYTISVTNFGPSSASSVVVTDALPAGVTFVSASGGGSNILGVVNWNLGTLMNNQVTNLTLIVAAPTSGSLTNVANVSTPTGDPNLTNNVTPPVVTSVTPVADVLLLNVGPTNVVAGAIYTNTISVTNTGPSVATNVVVVDTLPNGGLVTNVVVALAAGGGTNFTATFTAPGSGPLTNSATSTAGTFDPNLGNNTNIMAVTAVTPLADVAIGKSASGSVLATNNLTYTISVTNFGPSSASSVVVTDALPAGVTFVSASGDGSNILGVVNWNLGILTVNQVTNLTLIVTAPTSGSLTNVANVSTPTGDPNLTNNVTPPVVTSVTPVADVALGKTGPAATVYGTNFNYTISVTNFGPSTATGISVADSLPAGLVFVSSVPATTTNVGNQVVWSSLGNLAANATTNLILTVTASSSGTVTNIATGGSPTLDPNPTNNTSTPVVTVISKAQPVVTWPTPTNIEYGTPLGTNQNDATASVPGTFVYNPTNAIILPAGTNVLNVVFTPGNTNYAGTNLSVQLVVMPAPLTITASNASKVYGTTLTFLGTEFMTSGLVAGDSVTNVNLVSAGAASGAAVGSYAIVPSLAMGTGLTNYSIAYSNGVLTVGQGIYTASWPVPTNIVYGTSLGTNQNDATSSVPGTFVYNPTNGVILPAGTNTLQVIFLPGNTNYAGTNLSVQLVVTPAPLTIMASNVSKVYGTTLTLGVGQTAFASSGLVNSETIGSVTLTSAGAPNGAAAGNYPLVPSLAVGGTFNPANYSLTYSNGTLTVTKALLGITANPTNRVYGVANPIFTYTVSGLVNGDTTNVLDGSPSLTSPATTNSAAGSYPIVATNGTLSATNYVFSFTNGVLTVGQGIYMASWPVPTNIVYGTVLGTNQNDATASVPGTFSYNPTNGVILPAGTNALQVAFTPGNTNYAGTNLSVQLVVTPAPLVVTASNASKAYGTTLTFLGTEFTSSGLVAGDSVTNVNLASAGAPSGAAVGSYAIVPSVAKGTGLTNYSVTYSNGVLTVGHGDYAASWATPTNIVYGTPLGTNQNAASASVPGTFAYNPTNGVALPAGTNMLSLVFTPGNTNYTVTNLSVQLVVTPAPLTITASNANKTYGTTLAFLGTEFATTGLVAGDSVTNVSLTSVGAPVGAAVGSYAIVPSLAKGTGLTNYNIAYLNGVLTVGEGAYIANWSTPTNIVYGTPLGTNQNAASASVPGTFNYNPTNGIILPAGTNTLQVLFTPGNTNYAGTNLSVQLVVTPAPLVAAANNQVRGYNQPNPPLTYTLTGFVNGESTNVVAGSPVLNTTAVSNSPAGTYQITISRGSLVATNYSFSFTNGQLTVTNALPVANAQAVVTTENTALPITLTGSDPSHLPLTFVIASNPAHGTLSLLNTNTGAVTYTPATNFSGADSFTFRVNNGHTNSLPATVSLTVLPVADLVVVQTGPTNALAGSNLVYTVSVTNHGPATASGVVVTNLLSPGFTFVSASGNGSNLNNVVTWNIASLPVNGVTNLTVKIFAAEGGTFTNIASGAAAAADSNPTNNNGSLANARTRTVITPLADVAVFKVGVTNVYAGQPVAYTITATNAGPSTATNVVVQDNLPAGTTLQNASGSYGLSNGVVRWSGMTLAPGTAATFTLTVLAPASASSLLNVALSTSPVADPIPTNNNGSYTKSRVTTKVTPLADVVALLVGRATAIQNSNFVYAVSITNAGPSTSSNLVVSDSLPLGLTFVSATAGGKATNNVVVWPVVKALSLGAVTNYILTVRSTNPGLFTNTASALAVTYDSNLTNNTSAAVVTSVTNIPPAANPDNYVVTENTTNILSPLVNDVVKTPGGHLSLVSVSPTNGTATISGTNVIFIPATNFIGVATIGYMITDNVGGTNSSLITVTVKAANALPVANAQAVVTTENTTLPITLTGSDPSHLPLTFVIASNPAHGTLSLLNTNTGAVTYTPATNFSGADSFTFRVNSGHTNSLPATVSITVSATAGADVQVTLIGPGVVTVGDAFSFTNVVTNAGPATAVNTRVTNELPANLVFASASGGGVYSNGVVTWPVIASLTNGQVTNLVVTVMSAASSSTIAPTANPYNYILTNNPPVVGSATNRASAFAATFDPDLTNNIASAFYTNAQAQTLIVPGVFSIFVATNTYPTNVNPADTIIPAGTGLFIAGTNAFNPQTQLYEEFVSVTNIGQVAVHAVRLSISGLRSGVTLYNATGTNNGVPYVEYDPPYNSPLNPYPQAGSSVTFTLEFFVADRRPFTNSLTVTAIIAPVTSPALGTPVNIIQSGFNDVRNPANPRFLVEFTSIPGRTYTIEYSDDSMATWNLAVPSIVASATSTFWYDDGPPVTLSSPSYPNPSRFYRVLLNP